MTKSSFICTKYTPIKACECSQFKCRLEDKGAEDFQNTILVKDPPKFPAIELFIYK